MPDLQPFDDERVSAYIDGELTNAEREHFERLVEQRPDYRQAIDDLRTLRERVKALPAHGLSGGFAERVLRKAELATLVGPVQPAVTKQPASWLARNKTFVLIAGLAACLLAMVVLPYQTRKEPAVAAAPAETESAATRDAMATGTRSGEMGDSTRLDLGVASTDSALEAADLAATATDDAPTEWMAESAPESVAEADADSLRFGPAAGGFAGADAKAEVDAFGEAVLELVAVDDPEYQRLTEEARELLQQIEPENANQTWDIVVATELRNSRDWQLLNTALVSNQLQLQELKATPRREAASNWLADDVKPQSEQAADSFGTPFDAQRFDEQFFSKLEAKEALQRRTRANTRQLPGKSTSDEVDTHLLYVEGTKTQITNFMQSLPGAQTAQFQSNLRRGSLDLADKADPSRFERSLLRKKQDDNFRSATTGDQRLRQGRAVHLGRSSTKITTLHARQARAQQALAAAPPGPASAQPIDRQLPAMSKTAEGTAGAKLELAEELAGDAAGGYEEPVLRGLIILQDITEPVSGPLNK
jgi:hypothetical protein